MSTFIEIKDEQSTTHLSLHDIHGVSISNEKKIEEFLHIMMSGNNNLAFIFKTPEEAKKVHDWILSLLEGDGDIIKME